VTGERGSDVFRVWLGVDCGEFDAVLDVRVRAVDVASARVEAVRVARLVTSLPVSVEDVGRVETW